jgi:hypothetical protein
VTEPKTSDAGIATTRSGARSPPIEPLCPVRTVFWFVTAEADFAICASCPSPAPKGELSLSLFYHQSISFKSVQL